MKVVINNKEINLTDQFDPGEFEFDTEEEFDNKIDMDNTLEIDPNMLEQITGDYNE